MKFSKAKRILCLFLSVLMVASFVSMQSIVSTSAVEDACSDSSVGSHVAGNCSGDHSGYTAISSSRQTITTPGKYYLSNDIEENWYVTALTVDCSGEVTICLNGHKIEQTNNDVNAQSLVDVANGTVNLCDCVGTGFLRHAGNNKCVYLENSSVLNMYGGIIKDTYKYRGGAAVYAGATSTFNMYGGTITGNITFFDDGEAVYVNSTAKCNIYGGSITGNEAVGCTVYDNNTYISGDVKIKDNENGNLYLMSGKTITVGQLTEGAEIWVNAQDSGNVAITGQNDTDVSKYFHSDDSNRVIINKDNVVMLHSHEWIYSDDFTKHCDYCGAVEELAKVSGYSITLEDKIAVNYFMLLDDEVLADTSSKVEFTYINSGKTYTETIEREYFDENKVTVDGKDYYKFTCKVAAKEMTSNISAQVVTSDAQSEVFNYSVKQYAEVLLSDASKYADEQEIVKAMLNYGANAQTYFKYNTSNLANDTVYMTEADKTLNVDESVFNSYAHKTSGEQSGVSYYGSAISLESETGIKHFFKIADVESVDIKVDGKSVTPVKNGGYYEIKISDIRPDKLAESHTVTVGGLTLDYGVFSYGKLAMDTKNDTLKNTMKSLYEYNQAALAYSK